MSFFTQISVKDPLQNHLAFVDDFHNLQVSQPVRLVGTTFLGTTKDTNFWTEAVTGTGAVSQTGGEVTLNTGATANSTVQYQSVRLAKFIPAMTNVYRFVGRLSNTGSTNNVRNWGAFDANNGIFFQLSGTTLNVVTRNATVDTAVAEASWNVSTAFTLDTNIHSYEIRYSYVDVEFFIDEVPVHVINNITASSPFTASLDLPATLQNNNSGGGTANVSIIAQVNSIYRLGYLLTLPIFKNIHGAAATQVLKRSAGYLHRIVVNSLVNGTTITAYDALSATNPIGAIVPGSNTVGGTFEYNCPFATGLTVTTTNAATDITVIYE